MKIISIKKKGSESFLDNKFPIVVLSASETPIIKITRG